MPVTTDWYRKATELLERGLTVRQVALQLGVTTQAVYYAISKGYIVRPEPPAQ